MKKIFLSKTKRSRALIFGMKHHLVNVYQGFSNYTLGAKMASSGVTCFTQAYIGKNMKKIFLSETICPKALRFGL